jgi:hypothetical protein
MCQMGSSCRLTAVSKLLNSPSSTRSSLVSSLLVRCSSCGREVPWRLGGGGGLLEKHATGQPEAAAALQAPGLSSSCCGLRSPLEQRG